MRSAGLYRSVSRNGGDLGRRLGGRLIVFGDVVRKSFHIPSERLDLKNGAPRRGGHHCRLYLESGNRCFRVRANSDWRGSVPCCGRAADTVSALFRGTIWNETIPGERRGRLSEHGDNQFFERPNAWGNARAGWVASIPSRVLVVSRGA